MCILVVLGIIYHTVYSKDDPTKEIEGIIAQQKKERSNYLEKTYTDFINDKKYLAEKFPLTNSNKGLNANNFFNTLMPWVYTGKDKRVQTIIENFNKDKSKKLYLDETLNGKIYKWKFDSFDISGIPLATLDLGWFKNIQKFDHLEFEVGEPFNLFPKDLAISEIVSLPYASFENLEFWIKLRFIKSIEVKDYSVALKEVRQLATLLYSTNDLLGMLLGIVALNSERKFLALLKQKNINIPWATIDQETYLRARRFVEASEDFYNLDTPLYMLQEIFSSPPPIGFCFGMKRLFTAKVLFKPGLKGNYAAHFELFDGTKFKPLCNLESREKWFSATSMSSKYYEYLEHDFKLIKGPKKITDYLANFRKDDNIVYYLTEIGISVSSPEMSSKYYERFKINGSK